MLLSPRKNVLTSLFREVRVFKVPFEGFHPSLPLEDPSLEPQSSLPTLSLALLPTPPWLFFRCCGRGQPRPVWGRGSRGRGLEGEGSPSGTRGQTPEGAKERKRKSAKERKRAQKSAKERITQKGVHARPLTAREREHCIFQPRISGVNSANTLLCDTLALSQNCKQPGLKQPGLGTPKLYHNLRHLIRDRYDWTTG